MHFEPFYFILALIIGFIIMYLIKPEPYIIMKTPKPNNKNTLYIDDNDVCYRYVDKEIPCPNDSNNNNSSNKDNDSKEIIMF